MALDDLVDDVDKEQEKEEMEGILDELGVDSKEELQKLEDKLDRVQTGLIQYDKRMESIENRLDILEGTIARLIRLQSNNEKSSGSSNEESESTRQTTEGESEEEEGRRSDDGSGLDW